MGARSSNTHRSGSRNNSQNRLLNGHNASFYNSNLNAGNIGPNPAPGTAELSGGTIITTPTHKFHSFTSSGNLENTGGAAQANVSIIVVGGGGGGGTDSYGDNRGAGGGGGGGVNKWDSQTITGSTTYTVTVGNGGAGAPPTNSTPTAPLQGGFNGESSTFGSPTEPIELTVGGGGGGAGHSPTAHQTSLSFTTTGSGGGCANDGTCGEGGTYGNDGGNYSP